jgi:hypothetical protein
MNIGAEGCKLNIQPFIQENGRAGTAESFGIRLNGDRNQLLIVATAGQKNSRRKNQD